MSRIDTLKWGEFVLGNLFSIKNSKAYHIKDVVEDADGINYITRSKFNNGLKFKVKRISDLIINPANTISFGAENADFFVQTEEYITGNKMYYIDTRGIPFYALLYLKVILEKTFTEQYSFSDGMIPDRIKDKIIRLPITGLGKPDYSYMEKYMKSLSDKVNSSLLALQSARNSKQAEEICKWKSFLISDLFDVVKGKRLTKANMKDGAIPFVGASAINNGITAYISNSDHLHPANTITLSYNGSVGQAFYQQERFWASDDVNVLYPKFNINIYSAMFIIPILKAAGGKYDFIDKWKKDDMEKTYIYLPSNSNGLPDYEHMERYMKNIMHKTEKNIGYFSAV